MPPRTRGNKGIKTLKENIDIVQKTKPKLSSKIGKPPRKALADKTNSASDDNASIEVTKKVAQKPVTDKNSHVAPENAPRSRRVRRLPTRFVENNVLMNLSNSKKDTELQVVIARAVSKSVKTQTPVNKLSVLKSESVNKKTPVVTPQSNLENSLVMNRPKRISRLSSKFDEHAISPSKYPPVQPCYASTPILQNKGSKTAKTKGNNNKNKDKDISKVIGEANKRSPQKRNLDNSSDTNNNAKRRLIRNRKEPNTSLQKSVPVACEISPKQKTRLKTNSKNTKLQDKSFSFRVLEDKKLSTKRDESNLDVYEFTYDPNEEPPPAKKKRKRTVRKKPTQPKTVVFKNNYDKNVAKTLAVLKNVVSKKPAPKVVVTAPDNTSKALNEQIVEPSIPKTTTVSEQIKPQGFPTCDNANTSVAVPTKEQIKLQGLSTYDNTNTAKNCVAVPTNHTSNFTSENKSNNSVRVENIVADFDESMDKYNDIDYSPVNSPYRAKTPIEPDQHAISEISSVHNKDPLNLRDDLSFFDDHPVASSSINMSARHPQASPWRVDFNNLPIKWHVNTYVKPNMTPAVESSFINFDDNKKKHVYTNIMAEESEAVPEIESNNPSNLKQTSIISFIKEIAERSAKKKKRARSVTPTKENSIFHDVTGASVYFLNKTPKKVVNTPVNDKNVQKEIVQNVSSSSSKDKENLNEMRDHKKKKVKSTPKDKNGTFFGFDDTENQENMSPEKISNRKVRDLRPRSRAVLQEINAMTGPMRSGLPVAARSKVTTSSDAVNKVYEEMTAADAPVFPENHNDEVGETNIGDATSNTDINDDNSMSVHLFEDVELVHHLKPSRKSYGKPKKVTFQQHSPSSDTQDLDTQEKENMSSEEDDLTDLTFTMPCVQQKKPKKKVTKKQKMSKKEEQALEAWAAGFNSMCEDIEEFPLTVE